MIGTGMTCETALPAAVSAGANTWDRLSAQPKIGTVATAKAAHKILVVDDELWAALDMEWVVRQLGCEVVGPAATADAAIELAETDRPDLVLMDIRLANDGDGVAAAVEIRQRFDIPSLFVSAHGDAVTRDRAIAARPSGFIEKPFTPEALALAMKAALEPDET